MVGSLSLQKLVGASLALLAVLMGVGWMTREDPAAKPPLKILGGGFMFNYRIADVHYGFTAAIQRSLPAGSVIEAEFEDPAGGANHVVRERVEVRASRYTLRSPPLQGVEAGKDYHVEVRLKTRADDAVLWSDRLAFRSQLSDDVAPDAPLTVGPGYHRPSGQGD
ncbi:MAG TPA: hypothetical protein VGN97_04335 [Mesorhizobium sp.]|jgi:hypothetical protein|nr:hypothetical protein [Mesorhizobium sp.]